MIGAFEIAALLVANCCFWILLTDTGTSHLTKSTGGEVMCLFMMLGMGFSCVFLVKLVGVINSLLG